MMRVAALLCLAACDGVFGLNEVPLAPDGAGSGSSSAYTYVQFYEAHGIYGQQALSLPFAVVPEQGSLIVVAVGTFWNEPTSVTDTAGNHYQEVGTNPRSTGGSEVSIFYTLQSAAPSTFALTVNTTPSTVHIGQTEVTAIAHEYRGPFGPAPLDLDQSATGDGPDVGGTVDSNCGMLDPNGPSIMFAALTRDFNGTVTATPGWQIRKSLDLNHTMYSVLATQDRLAGPELAQPILSSLHQADGTSWACLWATFR